MSLHVLSIRNAEHKHPNPGCGHLPCSHLEEHGHVMLGFFKGQICKLPRGEVGVTMLLT